jgi:predicted solute-binding protein
MQRKAIGPTIMLFGVLPADPAWTQVADNEQEFQQMSAALKANEAERYSAITTCIKQGIGENPTAVAQFMSVPVEKAAVAWCTRMTNGIANGLLTLTDVNALNQGKVTPSARKVLTTMSEGE